jgi:[acyl-carrier-protein] S-malonyltransferase
MKLTLLFPGQGSQYVGMGKEEILSPFFKRANQALDFDLTKICHEGPEELLKMTENTQPAIVTHSVALFECIKPILDKKGIKIQSVLGHSVGEYSALVAAGVFKLEDALQAVRLRGQSMQKAVPVGVGAMIAVMRAPAELVISTCIEVSQQMEEVVMPANFNEPGQIVISGHKNACEEVAKRLSNHPDHRIRTITLSVSAPFHCQLMKPAEITMDKYLSSINFQELSIPYIANINAREYHQSTPPNTIKENLIHQISGSVLWYQSIEKCPDDTVFFEVGPGKILTGLIKKIRPHATVCHLDRPDLIEWLESEF